MPATRPPLGPQELAAFRAGDPETFAVLVDALSPRLLAVARRYAADGDEALDLVQQVWLRAFERRDAFTGRGPLVGWLLAIVRNVGLDAVRGRRAREERVIAVPAAGAQDAAGRGGPSHTRPPDQALERVELGRALTDALLELPERQRDVVVLRLVEGRSVRETAAAMGCAEGTVKASLHHALARLTPLLEEWRT